MAGYAEVAQLVVRLFCTQEVAGSIPALGSPHMGSKENLPHFPPVSGGDFSIKVYKNSVALR